MSLNVLVTELREGLFSLDALSADYRHQLEDYYIISFHETRATKGSGLV
jgi:hypothetical protein